MIQLILYFHFFQGSPGHQVVLVVLDYQESLLLHFYLVFLLHLDLLGNQVDQGFLDFLVYHLHLEIQVDLGILLHLEILLIQVDLEILIDQLHLLNPVYLDCQGTLADLGCLGHLLLLGDLLDQDFQFDLEILVVLANLYQVDQQGPDFQNCQLIQVDQGIQGYLVDLVTQNFQVGHFVLEDLLVLESLVFLDYPVVLGDLLVQDPLVVLEVQWDQWGLLDQLAQ